MEQPATLFEDTMLTLKDIRAIFGHVMPAAASGRHMN